MLRSLYEEPYTSLTVFRSLSSLAQNYVMRMLFLDTPLAVNLMAAWTKATSEAKRAHESSLKRLKELALIEVEVAQSTTVGQSAEAMISLEPTFRACLRRIITSPLSACPTANDGQAKDKYAPTTTELSRWATNLWESLLNHVIGQEQHPHDGVRGLLRQIGLLASSDTTGGIDRVTSDGFRFLFQSTHRQTWTIIRGYMSELGERNMNHREVLMFLFRLSFLKVGQDYPVAVLTPSQKKAMHDFCLFGIVYQRNPSSKRYYPTHLALNLASCNEEQDWAGAEGDAEEEGEDEEEEQLVEAQGHGFVIVETTFKLYAYTSSTLHIALLSRFVRIDYRLPNMIIGLVTRETVRDAVKSGISSHEMLHYLRHYAHPKMRGRKGGCVPTNVVDQIRIWEAERDRLKSEAGTLLYDFRSQDDFDETYSFADSKGMVVWSDRESLRVVVLSEGIDLIRTFRAGAGAQQTPVEAPTELRGGMRSMT